MGYEKSYYYGKLWDSHGLYFGLVFLDDEDNKNLLENPSNISKYEYCQFYLYCMMVALVLNSEAIVTGLS